MAASEEAVQRAAEVMLRQYEREHDVAQYGIKWQDFADDARAILSAALELTTGGDQ
jgi:hypothetical protein